jgi:hypothetical protein
MKPMDLTGQRFGRLRVLRKAARFELGEALRGEPNSFWHCHCECGTSCIIRGTNLARGITQSCGCYKRELLESLNVRRWGTFEERVLRGRGAPVTNGLETTVRTSARRIRQPVGRGSSVRARADTR